MKNNSLNTMIMLIITAMILTALNAALWLAAEKGVIPAIDNVAVWGAFVGLNIVSLVWATGLIGLPPLVVAFAYSAGLGMAFMGVRDMAVNAAEMMTAGATYGAFGVLAVGHTTTKVRLAFFHKGQVPFALVMVGLLVVDGLLVSRISQASAPVFLGTVVYPFVLAGVVPGLLLMISRRKDPAIATEDSELAETAVAEERKAAEQTEPRADQVEVPMPEEVEVIPAETPRIMPEEEPVEPLIEQPVPLVAGIVTFEEDFFIPFAIDESEEDKIQGFTVPSFEAYTFLNDAGSDNDWLNSHTETTQQA